jgi:SPASM domain peptide maturase of grasp-with-spasm system
MIYYDPVLESLNDEYYFKLFQCCIPVKGYARSLICDLQRGKLHLIPNSLIDVVNIAKEGTVKTVKSYFNNGQDEVINSYFDFLVLNELGFYCDESELKLFPDLNLEWKSPHTITNALIDIKDKYPSNYLNLSNQLDVLSCRSVEIRFYTPFIIDDIHEILSSFDCSQLECIYLLICYNQHCTVEDYEKLVLKYGRIEQITVHSCLEDKDEYFNTKKVIYSSKSITSDLCCGIITPAYFSSNLELFTEAQLHNTCLNRKIAIDVDGNIKNCPSMPHSYGNIKDTTLQEALEHPDFKKYWYIHKDQIEVCKDCEFRYICTDCRAYLEDPHNLYSKPLKCGYNPYTCEWEEWSTNPLKQQAIAYYGMQELVKKETRETAQGENRVTDLV